MGSDAGELTLTAADFQILRSIPLEWWDEEHAVKEISIHSARAMGVIRAAFTRFVALGLAERRVRHTIAPTREIRRIAKE